MSHPALCGNPKLTEPLGVSYIKALYLVRTYHCFSFALLWVFFFFSLTSSISFAHCSLTLWLALWGETPWRWSAERLISHSAICPSNDYLAARCCVTVGWSSSIKTQSLSLSLSLCISTRSVHPACFFFILNKWMFSPFAVRLCISRSLEIVWIRRNASLTDSQHY